MPSSDARALSSDSGKSENKLFISQQKGSGYEECGIGNYLHSHALHNYVKVNHGSTRGSGPVSLYGVVMS